MFVFDVTNRRNLTGIQTKTPKYPLVSSPAVPDSPFRTLEGVAERTSSCFEQMPEGQVLGNQGSMPYGCAAMNTHNGPSMDADVIRTHSREETIFHGEQFASGLEKGDVVVLEGDLGAGKTEFVKGICQYLAVGELVTSPTFTIINQYHGVLQTGEEVKVYHVDLYRIENADKLTEIGFDDMVFAHDAIKLVEWPQHAASHLPSAYWKVVLTQVDDDENSREITIVRHESETEAP